MPRWGAQPTYWEEVRWRPRLVLARGTPRVHPGSQKAKMGEEVRGSSYSEGAGEAERRYKSMYVCIYVYA